MNAPVVLPVADRWFERSMIDDSITLLWEPHVVPLMRCNIWHVRGRDRDLVIDTGMGVLSLVEEMGALLDKPVTAVATHGHDDHIGAHHEFDDVIAHPLEAPLLEEPPLHSLDPIVGWGAEAIAGLEAAGYSMTEPYFVDALPPGYVFEQYRQLPARVTRRVVDGDIVDTGDTIDVRRSRGTAAATAASMLQHSSAGPSPGVSSGVCDMKWSAYQRLCQPLPSA